MIKQEDKQVQSSILSFSSLEQQKLAKPEQATLRPSQEMSELPPLDFSTGSIGSLTRKGAEDCRIQNTLPLFSL